MNWVVCLNTGGMASPSTCVKPLINCIINQLYSCLVLIKYTFILKKTVLNSKGT